MKLLIYIVLGLALLTSCSSEDNKEGTEMSEQVQDQKQILTDKIAALESRVYAKESVPVKSDMHQLMLTYQEFANSYKEDENSPEYYFKAGELAYSMGKYDHSIDLFKKVIGTYDEYEKNPAAMFYIALVYHYKKKNDEAALNVYENIIKFYPDSHEAKESAASINLLGKTDEQIIEEFKKKNQAS